MGQNDDKKTGFSINRQPLRGKVTTKNLAFQLIDSPYGAG